mgnify:CR=1 FL=1
MEGSVYQYYANVRTEPVEWLWYPYIPLGKLTVLQGDPGEGKYICVECRSKNYDRTAYAGWCSY